MTRLTAVGAETTAQRLRIRLALWAGEYALDQRIGIPYAKLLGTKDSPGRISGPSVLEATLRQATITCPGISSVDQFTFETNAQRQATVTIRARSITGEPVVLTDFIVGAPTAPASP